jgi:hypothetical protein
MPLNKPQEKRIIDVNVRECEWSHLEKHFEELTSASEKRRMIELNVKEVPRSIDSMKKVFEEEMKEKFEDGAVISVPIFKEEISILEEFLNSEEEDEELQSLMNEGERGESTLGKRKLFEILEDFQDSITTSVERIIKKNKYQQDEENTVDEQVKIISDKKMLELKKDTRINKVIKYGVNYTNFEEQNWTKNRIIHESQVLKQVGRLLELVEISKDMETKKNASSLALKLIDRRMNALALYEEGESWENIDKLQPPLFSNRKNLFLEERKELRQDRMLQTLLTYHTGNRFSRTKPYSSSGSNSSSSNNNTNSNNNKFTNGANYAKFPSRNRQTNQIREGTQYGFNNFKGKSRFETTNRGGNENRTD